MSHQTLAEKAAIMDRAHRGEDCWAGQIGHAQGRCAFPRHERGEQSFLKARLVDEVAARDRTIAALADALEKIDAHIRKQSFDTPDWQEQREAIATCLVVQRQARASLAAHAEVIQRSREAK